MSDNTSYDFLKLSKVTGLLSLVLIAISFTSIAIRHFNFGIDFTGGTISDLSITDKTAEKNIKNELSLKYSKYKNNIFQFYNGGMVVKISTKDIKDNSEDTDNIVNILTPIKKEVVSNRIDFVNPQASKVLIKSGIISLSLSLFGILLYILFRFKLNFAVSAITTLLHNIILVFGFISLFQMNFDLMTVAAILIVIGYSVNDTVIIFDKIRENLKIYDTKDIYHVVNTSINSSLKRILYTSISTVLAILPLIFSPVSGLKNFGILVVFGISIGTYSSIFIASSMLVLHNSKQNGVNNEKGKNSSNNRSSI